MEVDTRDGVCLHLPVMLAVWFEPLGRIFSLHVSDVLPWGQGLKSFKEMQDL